MYKNAARNKWRWLSRRGLCSLEDLWDLSLEDLDSLYKGMNRQARELSEDSLLVKESRENEDLRSQIALVKDIVETKLAEAEVRKDKVANAARKARLLEILADKQDGALMELSEEEIQAQIAALG